jgi:hypothetical protein
VKPDGLSCQALEMIPAIQSAEGLKKKKPDRLYESHPEVAFAALAEGILPFNKKSLTGSLARALFLSRRLGIDVVRWVIKQESKTKIKADDWLDALAMAVVAYDWREKGNRWMLGGTNGSPEKWAGQADHLIALPLTSLRNVPETLCGKAVGRMVMASQRRMQKREREKRRSSEQSSLQG